MNRKIVFAALSVAIVLGTASAVLAGPDRYFGPRGYQVQTWQDIEQARQDIQRQIQIQYHLGKAGNTDGYVASPKHHPSRKQTRDR